VAFFYPLFHSFYFFVLSKNAQQNRFCFGRKTTLHRIEEFKLFVVIPYMLPDANDARLRFLFKDCFPLIFFYVKCFIGAVSLPGLGPFQV